MAENINRAAVIGHPIGHSRSPLIHGHWLARYGIAGEYTAKDISPADLSRFIESIRSGRWLGCNATIPHKEAIGSHLDRLTAEAGAIGAVNTVWREGARLIGDNTDAYGFAANLDEAAPGWDGNGGGRALVIGAGGAALAVVHALIQRDFNEIRIANRTPDRAVNLAERFGRGCSGMGLDDSAAAYGGANLVVNTSAMTMNEDPAAHDWPGLDRAAPDAVVHDIVYSPLKTSLLAAAETRGLRAVDGLGMLLHQAVPGFERWFGSRPEVTLELRETIIADLGAH